MKYIVIGDSGANIRDNPSTKLGKIIKNVKKGTILNIIEDWTAVNTVGSKTVYFPVEGGGYVSESLLKKWTDYAKIVENTYNHAIGCTHGGSNVSKVVSLDTVDKYKTVTCNRIASCFAQEAGLLENGKIVSHTASKSGKKCIPDAVTNYKLLENTCNIYFVNKKYADLPEKMKKAGCLYYQDSNACVSAGNGIIYSCNESSGQMSGGKYKTVKRTSGYPFTSPILVVAIPKELDT